MLRTLARLLSIVPAVALAAAGAEAAERVAAAVVFAVDVSGSVNAERYELQRAGIAGVFADAAIAEIVGDGLAVTLMEWSDGHAVSVPWTILRSAADAEALARTIARVPRAPGYSTELSLALLAAADLLAACPCEAASRIIDVSGDGSNNGPISTPIARDEVVARGIRINGLPIVTPAEPDLAQWYRDNVVGGDGGFMEVANGYEDFARAMRRKFLLEVAALGSRPRRRGRPRVLRRRKSVARKRHGIRADPKSKGASDRVRWVLRGARCARSPGHFVRGVKSFRHTRNCLVLRSNPKGLRREGPTAALQSSSVPRVVGHFDWNAA